MYEIDAIVSTRKNVSKLNKEYKRLFIIAQIYNVISWSNLMLFFFYENKTLQS